MLHQPTNKFDTKITPKIPGDKARSSLMDFGIWGTEIFGQHPLCLSVVCLVSVCRQSCGHHLTSTCAFEGSGCGDKTLLDVHRGPLTFAQIFPHTHFLSRFHTRPYVRLVHCFVCDVSHSKSNEVTEMGCALEVRVSKGPSPSFGACCMSRT